MFAAQALMNGGKMLPYPKDRQNPYIIQYKNAMMTPMAIAAGRFSFTNALIPVAAPVKTIIMQINGKAIFPFRSTL